MTVNISEITPIKMKVKELIAIINQHSDAVEDLSTRLLILENVIKRIEKGINNGN